MATVFTLTFATADGASKAMRIPHARKNLSTGEVRDAMNLLRASSAFMTKNGGLVSPMGARLTDEVKTPFNVR